MSGANGVEKFQRVDREERIHPKTLSPRFYSRFPNPGAAPANEFINPITQAPDPTRLRYPLLTQTVPVGTIDAQQALNDILLTTASSAAITGPSAAQIAPLLGQLFLTSLGNGLLGANPNNEIDGYNITIENNDPTVTKVITFGAGVTPATISVPPLTILSVNVEVTANNPPLVRTYVVSSASSTIPPTNQMFSAHYTGGVQTVAPTVIVNMFAWTEPTPNFFNTEGILVNATGVATPTVTGVYSVQASVDWTEAPSSGHGVVGFNLVDLAGPTVILGNQPSDIAQAAEVNQDVILQAGHNYVLQVTGVAATSTLTLVAGGWSMRLVSLTT